MRLPWRRTPRLRSDLHPLRRASTERVIKEGSSVDAPVEAFRDAILSPCSIDVGVSMPLRDDNGDKPLETIALLSDNPVCQRAVTA
jgi:hypothetical protein